MSYPSSLDLAFGSEKATADTISYANLAGSNSLPKTQEEIDALVEQGLAYECTINACHGGVESLDDPVLSTLPYNLKGMVCVLDNEVVRLSYHFVGNQVVVDNFNSYINGTAYVILKQAVD